MVGASLGPQISVFSYLRSRSELWVARQFAQLKEYHGVFRSCNRAFHQNPADRLGEWCGTCDKCCFIDLVLSPFMEAEDLRRIFGGREPLDDAQLEGDVGECRAAVELAADRPDRQGAVLLQSLRAAVEAAPRSAFLGATELLSPLGSHGIPDRYAPPDLLVRAH
jgi:hypothetical protein